MQKRHSALYLFGCAGIISLIGSGAAAQYKVPSPGSVIDLSPTVQFDCPPHMMADQDTGLPNSGYWGFMTCDKVPAWQMVGQVVKVDGRGIYDQAPAGQSPVFTVQMVEQTEKELGRELRPGDAVLYWSHYNDTRGAPGEDPNRLQIDVLEGEAPAWPGPNFATGDFVGSKGVTLFGLDSPSIGAFGDPDYTYEGPQSYRSQTGKAIESHLGVFKHGGVDVEGLIHLDQVPNGSIFFGLSALAAFTGLRAGELVGLRAKDLQLMQRRVQVHQSAGGRVGVRGRKPVGRHSGRLVGFEGAGESLPGLGFFGKGFWYQEIDEVPIQLGRLCQAS